MNEVKTRRFKKALIVTDEDLEALSDTAMADVCTGGDPRQWTREEVLAVYRKALG